MRQWRLIACAALALVQISKQADWESGARDGFLSSISPECDMMKPRCCVTLRVYKLQLYSLCEVFFLFVFPYVGIWFPGNFSLPEAEEWHWPESDRVGATQRPSHHAACNTLLHKHTLATQPSGHSQHQLCPIQSVSLWNRRVVKTMPCF